MKYPIGIIGVGNMGGAMAANLLSNGWVVHVCDLDSSKTSALARLGAVVHATPASIAAHAQLLIVCVVNGQQTKDVLFGSDGAAQELKSQQSVMLCPTISPNDVMTCAKQLQALGVDVLDAPMSGGPARARQGIMSLMLACENAIFDQYKTALDTLANPVFHISQNVGDGAKTKLVNNLLASINLAATAEILALSEKMGLNLTKTLDVIEHSSGQNWIGSDRMRRAIGNDFAPLAHMTLLAKDSRLAIESANHVGFISPLGSLAAQLFATALKQGMADLDDGSMLQLMRGQDFSS